VRKAFRYCIYPTKKQGTMLEQTLTTCCELYNAALQEHSSFQAFFRRVKAGGKAGFPRFRSHARFDRAFLCRLKHNISLHMEDYGK
jgi:hypothetical protein